MDSTYGELFRFCVVGVGVNVALYLSYLELVAWHLTPQAAMSLTFACGAMLGFALNRRWSFGRAGTSRGGLIRYLAVYFAGKLHNLAALALYVNVVGLRHQIVQAVMVPVVAGLAFLLQKHWVFDRSSHGPEFRI